MTYPIIVESAGGEYMDAVLIIEWAAKIGDPVKAGQTIVTVETAKAATEVQASHDGYLTEILFEVGQEAPVGVSLGTISESRTATAPVAAKTEAAPAAATSSGQDRPVAAAESGKARIVASPLARRVARDADLDLAGITGSGPRGRIRRKDVDAALAARIVPTAAAVPAAPLAAGAAPAAATAAFVPGVAAPRSVDPVVFLHGFGADRQGWRWVTPLLNIDNEVIALDLPGHGASAADPARTPEEMAFFISDLLEQRGIGAAHLVAHSMGCAVALALSEIGRFTIRSLCLIAPAGLGPEINGGFLNGFARAQAEEDLKPWLERMVADPSILPGGFAKAVLRQRDREGTGPAQLEIVERLFPVGTQRVSMTRALRNVKVPARIIWGLRDAVIPHTHAFAAGGGIGLHLLENIGHVPQMECPELVARLIRETIRSV